MTGTGHTLLMLVHSPNSFVPKTLTSAVRMGKFCNTLFKLVAKYEYTAFTDTVIHTYHVIIVREAHLSLASCNV